MPDLYGKRPSWKSIPLLLPWRLAVNAMPFDLGYSPVRSQLARPGYNGTSLQDAARRFPSEDACFDHVMETRYGQDFACIKCGRISRWHRRRGAKYVQHSCGAVISPLAGTVFHGTKIPLRLWYYALLHFANSQEGVNAGFLGRQLGISYLAAFRMAQRIRRHLAAIEGLVPIAAPGEDVEVRLQDLHRIRTGPGRPNRANILFAARAGNIDCEVIDCRRQHIALNAVARMVPGHGTLHTTCYRTTRLFSAYGARPSRTIYLPTYFLDHPDQVNAINGFLSYFLWPFQTHHKHASREHLWLYLKEFQFRYNRRHRSADTYWDMTSAFPILGPLGSAHIPLDPAEED